MGGRGVSGEGFRAMEWGGAARGGGGVCAGEREGECDMASVSSGEQKAASLAPATSECIVVSGAERHPRAVTAAAAQCRSPARASPAGAAPTPASAPASPPPPPPPPARPSRAAARAPPTQPTCTSLLHPPVPAARAPPLLAEQCGSPATNIVWRPNPEHPVESPRHQSRTINEMQT